MLRLTGDIDLNVRKIRLFCKKYLILRVFSSLFSKIFTIPFIIPVLLSRVLRPIIRIRFGLINSSRFGAFSGDCALYLAEKKAGLHEGNLDIFYFNSPCSNNFLKKKLKPHFNSFFLGNYLLRANQWIPGTNQHKIVMTCGEDTYDLLKDSPLPISFSSEEESLGKKTLQKLGIPDGNKFVCFANRESTYLNKQFPGQDWSHHVYRDSDVQNYVPAMEEMVKRGYFVFRMGSAVKEPLELNNPKIIDYACSKERNEFMDLYLYARCCFAVGSFSGVTDLAVSLGKPVAAVNTVVIIGGTCLGYSKTILCPKLIYSKAKGGLMTLNEIIDSNCLSYSYSKQFEKDGLELFENDPKMITQTAIEVEERTRGTWIETKEDKNNQKLFWDTLVNRVNLKRLRGFPDIVSEKREKVSAPLWKISASALKIYPELTS